MNFTLAYFFTIIINNHEIYEIHFLIEFRPSRWRSSLLGLRTLVTLLMSKPTKTPLRNHRRLLESLDDALENAEVRPPPGKGKKGKWKKGKKGEREKRKKGKGEKERKGEREKEKKGK